VSTTENVLTLRQLIFVDLNLGSCFYLFFFRDFSVSDSEIRLIVIGILPKFTETSMMFLINFSFFPVVRYYVVDGVGRQFLQLRF
jgi:hypothetical protein